MQKKVGESQSICLLQIHLFDHLTLIEKILIYIYIWYFFFQILRIWLCPPPPLSRHLIRNKLSLDILMNCLIAGCWKYEHRWFAQNNRKCPNLHRHSIIDNKSVTPVSFKWDARVDYADSWVSEKTKFDVSASILFEA